MKTQDVSDFLTRKLGVQQQREVRKRTPAQRCPDRGCGRLARGFKNCRESLTDFRPPDLLHYLLADRAAVEASFNTGFAAVVLFGGGWHVLSLYEGRGKRSPRPSIAPRPSQRAQGVPHARACVRQAYSLTAMYMTVAFDSEPSNSATIERLQPGSTLKSPLLSCP